MFEVWGVTWRQHSKLYQFMGAASSSEQLFNYEPDEASGQSNIVDILSHSAILLEQYKQTPGTTGNVVQTSNKSTITRRKSELVFPNSNITGIIPSIKNQYALTKLVL